MKGFNKCKRCGNDLSSTRQSAMYCLDCVILNNKERQKRYKSKKVYTDDEIIKGIYSKYKSSAKKRNHSFDLPINVFKDYYKSECHYCGDTLRSVGFDRVDNTKGYSLDNIVPCCTVCNIMKHKVSKDSFIQQCQKIVDNLT